MEFIVKKTNELNLNEISEILFLFKTVFKKERTIEHFKNQFFNTPIGYSYHSLIVEKERIVGSYSCIPSYYHVDDKKFIFAAAVDDMISENYRGFQNFYRMINSMDKYLLGEGIAFILSFPNDTAYPVLTKSRLMKDIGNLKIYCLPYRIGGIKYYLKLFNIFSITFARLYIFFASLCSDNKVYHFPVEKDNETHNFYRYKWFDGDYNIVNHHGSGFVYKLMEYENVRTVFLIDVFEKSAINFIKAVQYIVKNHHKKFDILIYVGFLPFKRHGLMSLPQKFSPKNFHFIGKVLQKGSIEDNFVFNINNWDVNLSNYDLL
jgi:hypothetical protein